MTANICTNISVLRSVTVPGAMLTAVDVANQRANVTRNVLTSHTPSTMVSLSPLRSLTIR